MAQLLVREVDEALVLQLKRTAAAHGRSAEAEHREILRKALADEQPKPTPFKEVLASMPYFDDDDLFDVR
ncbi:DNA-binding protein [Lacisediminimonas sp.]|uniref:FitA-like ribbon-helix-helix domain-containing protein n=1 Tax=Lacisediminimonas sp. TaxID=3060582 RepID=UPI00271BCBB0|nr:DNA-binding protein [Lacisediminimonas sp.]MDO8298845.1 DNA-binding protein [Lacisediminimonas sp.]MDO9217698.1 DNA-binding protein [Lacisediminimonas sp.]